MAHHSSPCSQSSKSSSGTGPRGRQRRRCILAALSRRVPVPEMTEAVRRLFPGWTGDEFARRWREAWWPHAVYRPSTVLEGGHVENH